jgi:hypothetical protein
MTTTRKDLRDQIRRQVRDEASGSYVFTDAELNTYLANAIRAYSKDIPREISTTLNLVDGQAEYSLPEGCREIVSLNVGTTEYSVIDIFAGVMTISPTPTAAAVATFRYRGCHTIPTADTGEGSTSTYDAIDEPLIAMHVKAQCWETLAGDGARYYQYREGDVEENQGKTQEQFRKEADRLYAEFAAGVASSKDTLQALRPTAEHTIAGVVSRESKQRGANSIYRGRYVR